MEQVRGMQGPGRRRWRGPGFIFQQYIFRSAGTSSHQHAQGCQSHNRRLPSFFAVVLAKRPVEMSVKALFRIRAQRLVALQVRRVWYTAVGNSAGFVNTGKHCGEVRVRE